MLTKQKSTASLLLLSGILAGCADMSTQQGNMHHANGSQGPKMVIAGGDAMMQQWTQDAVTAYCTKKYWPSSIKKISHSSAAAHPMFNQPRKTKVIVSKDNTLHIHFKLGGVLMDNFSHELIVYPPHYAACKIEPMHYEVTMQPQGNAVIYVSKPQKVIVTQNVSSSS